jgi:hypothetical protein
VEFDGKVWVIGGIDTNFSDEAWSSTDGVNWTEETEDSSKKFSARGEHSSIVYDDYIWIIGGRVGGRLSNDVWRSDDGKNWEQVKPNDANGFSARVYHETVVFDDDDGDGEKMWVIGGNGRDLVNDVWSSTNGVTWTEETKDSSKKFTVRSNHQSVVYEEEIWIIGGGADNDIKKDVWKSEDGKNWDLVTSSATFGVRASHQSVVFDDKMWVIGGSMGNSNIKNDVWSSTNGITWTEVKPNDANGFSARQVHSSEVFDSKVWVFGGRITGGSSNDVWFMERD